MCLSVSCAFAVRRAIEAGRAEVEEKIDYFQLGKKYKCLIIVFNNLNVLLKFKMAPF